MINTLFPYCLPKSCKFIHHNDYDLMRGQFRRTFFRGRELTSEASYAQMADKTKIFNGKPTLKELSQHIILGPEWYIFGTQLGLDSASLDGIQTSSNDDVHYRTARMFKLWLNKEDPHPTRQQILDTLRLEIIGLNRIANDYEDALRNGSK